MRQLIKIVAQGSHVAISGQYAIIAMAMTCIAIKGITPR
jgi:nitric oxide reductase large subunit